INGTFYFAHRIPIFTVVIAVEDEHGSAWACSISRSPAR
ncbi:MAG: hypothetical protein QOI07_4013, partial [Verrucomicrobiota bacterium]